MKMQCEIIRDLIPLMEDDVCSPQSRDAVLGHIKTCADCRQLYENAKIQPVFELRTEEAIAQKSIKRGFRKVKRRWAASILLVVFLIPIVFLTWGQVSGRGVSFTNIHEILIAESFLRDLTKEDYEAAFSHMDIDSMKEEWLAEWFDEEKLENFAEDAQRVFCESASLLTEIGGIQDFEFLAIDQQPDFYRIYYTIAVNGEQQELSLGVTDDGIEYFFGNGSYIDDPVAHFGLWSEYLWQEYKGCYLDPETHQYRYRD